MKLREAFIVYSLLSRWACMWSIVPADDRVGDHANADFTTGIGMGVKLPHR